MSDKCRWKYDHELFIYKISCSIYEIPKESIDSFNRSMIAHFMKKYIGLPQNDKARRMIKNELIVFNESENKGIKYCPYCGKPIEEVENEG